MNPFGKVGATLSDPDVELDPANTVLTGGAALATAGLSPRAKSFSDRFPCSCDPCGEARRERAERELERR